MIAIPDYGATVSTKCMFSILALIQTLQQKQIDVTVTTYDHPEVAVARNELSGQMLLDKTCTNILFVDNDISFHPNTVLRMLDSGKDLIGCTYPRRSLDLSRAFDLTKRHTPSIALAKASTHVVYNGDWSNTKVVDGKCKVEGVGMGLCLIARAVFTRLIETATLRHTPKPEPPNAGYGFFDPIITHDRYVSEDFSFCERWRACGGEVWASIAEDIGHVGSFVYRSKLIDALKP